MDGDYKRERIWFEKYGKRVDGLKETRGSEETDG